MERLKKRRENHNSVERKRRDNINHTILEISQLIPQDAATNTKSNKGNILRMAAEYIKELQMENQRLKSRLSSCNKSGSMYPGTATTHVGSYTAYPTNRLFYYNEQATDRYVTSQTVKVEQSGHGLPNKVTPHPPVIQNSEYGYNYQRLPAQHYPTRPSLPLPSIDPACQYPPVHRRGLMRIDYHNTLNLV
ncbi:HLH-domain-containing protein [Basidiobolus meristosporus CBS 931.73]|uniref:HLH-domain-containing protein n=1 Tax=Basidiobolus meristosporus CBS 931.73 TaxID=1314790 RepID=A0A1Y1Y114_9FUNG|nr:HLH-domain-containing protein [Basidiobolus meristosporus CBS 931.73]|eukprot:ORX91649.1 HLH-domain-containing protein [Basidiobolus meristosporus CBS 931.73]